MTLGGGEAYDGPQASLQIFILFRGSLKCSIFPHKIPQTHPISGIQTCLEGAEHF